MRITNPFLLVALLVLCSQVKGLAQCGHSIELEKKTAASPGAMNGQIELSVKGSGHFEVQLLSVAGTGETKVAEKSGNGSSKISFKNLDGNGIYVVRVQFRDEEKFLCKNRVISDIFLTERKSQ